MSEYTYYKFNNWGDSLCVTTEIYFHNRSGLSIEIVTGGGNSPGSQVFTVHSPMKPYGEPCDKPNEEIMSVWLSLLKLNMKSIIAEWLDRKTIPLLVSDAIASYND